MAETKTQSIFFNNKDNFLHVDGNILETDTIHAVLNNEDTDKDNVIYNEGRTPMKHVQTYLQAHNVTNMFTKYFENKCTSDGASNAQSVIKADLMPSR
jgi:hypothetical protein